MDCIRDFLTAGRGSQTGGSEPGEGEVIQKNLTSSVCATVLPQKRSAVSAVPARVQRRQHLELDAKCAPQMNAFIISCHHLQLSFLLGKEINVDAVKYVQLMKLPPLLNADPKKCSVSPSPSITQCSIASEKCKYY